MYSSTLNTVATDRTAIFSWCGLPIQYFLTDLLSATFTTNGIHDVTALDFLYLFTAYLVLPFMTTFMIGSSSSSGMHTIVCDKAKAVATVNS
jgi:hypothetical protein